MGKGGGSRAVVLANWHTGIEVQSLIRSQEQSIFLVGAGCPGVDWKRELLIGVLRMDLRTAEIVQRNIKECANGGKCF